MNFDREPWRKLYVFESTEHRLLPLFSRGLRDYLLRYSADDGTILRDSKDRGADLAKVLCATALERRQIEAAVADLIRVGFLAADGGRLWIVKFEDAQSPRSPGAKRQAKYAERVLADAVPDAVPDKPPDELANSTLEEKRREREYIRQVFEFWVECHGHRRAKLEVKRFGRIRARLREGFDVDDLKTAIKNAKNDPWLMGKNPDNKVWDGLETLLRDAAQVERLIELSNGKSAVIEIQ